MSLARVATFAFAGIEAVPVEVQVQLAPGLPAFLVVGLADKAVGESRERVRAALTGLGLSGERFKLLIGMGFLLVVFFSPDGVLGLWERWQDRRRSRRDPLTGGAP